MSLLALVIFASAAGAAAPMPEGEALNAAIEQADAALFWAAFEGCDAAALEGILAPEYRMIHDLGGLAIPSRQSMVDQFTEECAARAPGGKNAGYKNRRRLTPGSRVVRKMGDWGALEEGAHVFFEWRSKTKEWALVGGAHYMHVWKWEAAEGKFRLSESLSYDHGAASAYPFPSDRKDGN
jgi:hypothetical protein